MLVSRRLICRYLLNSAVMHDLRLIHTDLKPENILLVSPEYVKVPDYKVVPMLLGSQCLVNLMPVILFSTKYFWFLLFSQEGGISHYLVVSAGHVTNAKGELLLQESPKVKFY